MRGNDYSGSTNALSFPNATSHSLPITSSVRFASAIWPGSSCQSLSRPNFTSRTTPASASTRRCLVTPCRLISVFAVSCAIENAPPAQSRATSFRRVGSPSAAKTFARTSLDRTTARRPASRFPAPFALPLRADMAHDVVHLPFPASAVHAERFQATVRGHVVEGAFPHAKQRALAGHVFTRECHERRLLLRVVHGRVDGIRMPAVREQILRFDALDEIG